MGLCQVFGLCAPDREYDHVYRLRLPEMDQLAHDTGREFYFGLKRDESGVMTGEIFAAVPADVAHEFSIDTYERMSPYMQAEALKVIQSQLEPYITQLSHIPSDETGQFDPSKMDIEFLRENLENGNLSRILESIQNGELPLYPGLSDDSEMTASYDHAEQRRDEEAQAFLKLIDDIKVVIQVADDAVVFEGMIDENAMENAGMVPGQQDEVERRFGAETSNDLVGGRKVDPVFHQPHH